MEKITKCIWNIFLLSSLIFSTVLYGESSSGHEGKRVTLLISVSGLSQGKFQDMAETIAKNFHDQFSDRFDPRVIFQADQADLFAALNDENNIGVFWVSHSNSAEGMAGTNLDGRIIDSKGIDVSNIFTKIHSNLKWLGVIACKALPIFQKKIAEESYGNRKFFLYNTSLNLSSFLDFNKSPIDQSFTGTVMAASSSIAISTIDAKRNFSKAATYLNRFTDQEQEQSLTNEKNENEFRLKITRTPAPGNKTMMDSVQVLLQDKILYVFPPSNTREEAEIIVHWDFSKEEEDDISFVVDSGLSSNKATTPPNLGLFKFSSKDLKTHWSVVKMHGAPLGVNQNNYQPN